jgi:hypothetical protein
LMMRLLPASQKRCRPERTGNIENDFFQDRVSKISPNKADGGPGYQAPQRRTSVDLARSYEPKPSTGMSGSRSIMKQGHV